LAVVVLAWAVFFGIAFVLTVAAFPDRWKSILTAPYLIAVFFVGCLVLLPIDRVCEERYRKLEKMTDDTHAA
jgi:cytochrome bd-type quinol oxidase subunit 2